MVYTRRRSIGRLLHEKRKITRPKMLKILVLTSKNITYLIIKRFQLMVRKEISSFNLNQSVIMSTPTSLGCRGIGTEVEAGALGGRGEPAPILQRNDTLTV